MGGPSGIYLPVLLSVILIINVVFCYRDQAPALLLFTDLLGSVFDPLHGLLGPELLCGTILFVPPPSANRHKPKFQRAALVTHKEQIVGETQ